MILTQKHLNELEISMRTFLTKEQRVILFLWYGTEPMRYEWTEEDIVHGFHDVMRYYPDHRLGRIPNFLQKDNPEGEPF